MLRPPLLIVDGRIPTTAIAERLLRDAYGGCEVRTGEELLGAQVLKRPLFISRLCHPRFAWLPEYLHARGVPYVYLLDDHFFALTPDYDRHNGAFFSHPAVHETLTAFLRGARAVWLMSEVLAAQLRARLPELDCRVVPAPVDLALFDACFARRAPRPRPPEVWSVGYASTRRPNVAALLTQLVERASARFGPRLRFEFIGWCPDAIAAHPAVQVFAPIEDYARFVQTMLDRHWDVALAPLGDSVFENAKTNLKYREYAAARIPGLFSAVPLYANCVRDGETGLLVGFDPEAWVEALTRLLADSALREAIVRQALAEVRAKHAQPVVAQRVRETFDDCFAQTDASSALA
ncbi:MAG: glycosyltransferase [Casimicrobiaceae bacterium]|nr:glycosyltransferase [Casimicrobiaceae bacterium]